MILLLLACARAPAEGDAEGGGAGGVDPACATAPQVTWDSFAHGFFTTYCLTCHSPTAPDRHGAPEGLDLHTEAAARAQAQAIRDSVLVAGTMPVGGGVLEADLELLSVWIDCGDR